MHVVIEKQELEYAVSVVSKALASKPDGKMGLITLSTESDKLVLATGNSEIVLSYTLATSEILEQGTVNVSGKVFCEAIKKMPKGDLELKVENKELHLVYVDGRFAVPVMPVDSDWLKYRLPSKARSITLDTKVFKQIIKQMTPFCSMDAARPLLKGVSIKTSGKTMYAAALDGYRISKTEVEIESDTDEINVVVPASSLNCISSFLSDEGTVTLQLSNAENLLLIKHGDITFTSLLLAGEFIDYNRIIPTTFNTYVAVKKDDFLQAIERAMILNDMSCSVNFNVLETKVEVSAKSVIGETKTNVEAKVQGKDVDIKFNGKYIVSALKVINNDMIFIGFNKENEPAVIKDGKSMYLFLPIRKM